MEEAVNCIDKSLFFIVCHTADKVKVKLPPKCNLDFFCECIWVKSIFTTKEALLRFAVFSFSGQTHFQWECYGHFYDSIKIYF